MGALHAGHLSLISLARKYSDDVVVSIFVNPLQFENPDDLAKYPRDLEGDRKLALQAGATTIWAPTVEEIYPGEVQQISAGPLGNLFEGVKRPGHFDGVLTVVARLFEKVKPTHAIFGEKDFQQLYLISRFVKENDLPIQIVAGPLIRDEDGLALSSRNVRLTSMGRNQALVIQRALHAAHHELHLEHAKRILHAVLSEEPGFTIDYATIIDEQTFSAPTQSTTQFRALVAGWVEGVRLLDNMKMVIEA